MNNLTDLGVAGLAVVAIIMLIDFIRKRFRESDAGDRRKATVVGCPNKVEGLAETLLKIHEQATAQTAVISEQIRLLQRTSMGVDRLLEQHKAGPDGVETWKLSPRLLVLQEETRDALRDLVRYIRNGNTKNLG